MELTVIKGIGEKRKKLFEENNIFSCEDLINYFPYKYLDFSTAEPFAEDGRVKLIKVKTVENAKIITSRKTHLVIVSCKVKDDFDHIFTAVWFNQKYLTSQLKESTDLFVYGKNSPTKRNHFNVSMHKLAKNIDTNKFLPIYHTISGIGQKTLQDLVEEALKLIKIDTIIPKNILLNNNLQSLQNAYYMVHNLTSETQLNSAFSRIGIEKLVPIFAFNEFEKNKYIGTKEKLYFDNQNIIDKYLNLLPYSLTNDQKNAIDDIFKDMTSTKPMNRLLQGDVGSGKTVVAMFGAFLSAKNGHQSVILAPTEILANQHFETISKIFASTGIAVRKLTNQTSVPEKNRIVAEIRFGYAQVIVATHSILNDNIKFKDLTYIVIDEQHRFGVEQRAKLGQKGTNPDILVMSATPIPRSLNLVLYGHLDISTILSRPKENKIETHIVIKSKQNDMWNYLKSQAETGAKIFVVCSKIDEENDDDSQILLSANNVFEKLKTIFKPESVGLIHGKLTKDAQNKVIDEFKNGNINVLVATTIIEVGVDIPSSNYMVIVSPERHGLATLHQLRGRIGRAGEESYCFCLDNGNFNEQSYNRLKFFKNNSDGFKIAEYDFKSRGGGSIYDTNQHGENRDFMGGISFETITLSQKIYNEIKLMNLDLTKLSQRGKEIKYQNQSKNIIFN